MLLIGLLGVAGLLATFSRAGLVAFVFEVPLCIWLARRLGYMTSRTFNLAVFSGIFIAAVSGPLLYFYLSTRPANVSIRLTQYEGTARMIAANPILGVGLNNSTEMLKLYTASTSGPTQDPTRSAYKQPIHSHPLAVIAEIGLVGFCFYFLFYVSMARSGFRLLRARDPEVALTAAIFLAGLLALWVHLLGDPLSEDPILTLMLFSCGVLAGLTRSEQLRSRVRPSPSPADFR
jgi:O-antigen ligase